MKKCFKCKQVKPLTDFEQYRNRGKYLYYKSYCKSCKKIADKEYFPIEYKRRKEKFRKYPWLGIHFYVVARCSGNTHPYSKKGIKNFLSKGEIKYLWFRDRAYLLKEPSIDRINGGDYSINNCRFIEMKENSRLGSLGRKHPHTLEARQKISLGMKKMWKEKEIRKLK